MTAVIRRIDLLRRICFSILLHTGYGNAQGEAARGGLAHKFVHSLKLRQKLDSGAILRPPRPVLVPPPPPRRGVGDVQLGTLTADAAERDKQRAQMSARYMADVEKNPEQYAKDEHKPAVIAANLVRYLLLWFPVA